MSQGRGRGRLAFSSSSSSSWSAPSSSSSSASRLSSNADDRLRSLIISLTKPVQLSILNQSKLEEQPRSSSDSAATSSLSSTSSLLRSQARLKSGYVDWEDGLSQVKSLVREAEDGARRVCALLTERLRAKSSDSRLLCLYIIDALFQRSQLFRVALLESLHPLLELCCGIAASASSAVGLSIVPLPPPAEAAAQLKQEAVRVVSVWHRKYGSLYRVLALGYKYMMDALGLEDDSAARRRREDEQRDDRRRADGVLRVLYDKLSSEWEDRQREVESTISSVDSCLSILFPPAEEWNSAAEAEETKDSKASSLPTAGSTEVIETVAAEEEAKNADGVDWEEEDEARASSAVQELPAAERIAAVGAADSDGDAESDSDAARATSWEALYLRAGGSSEVGGDEESLADGDATAQAATASWEVDRTVADAALGSRGYQLDIQFESNLGHMESEETRAVFETLRDCCRLMQRAQLPLLNEWLDVLHSVKLNTAATATEASSSSSSGVQDRQIRSAFAESQRCALTAAVTELISRLTDRLRQCRQLNIHFAQLSTIQSQLLRQQQQQAEQEAADEAKRATAAAGRGEEEGDDGSLSRNDRFFGSLREKRKRAVRKVGKYAKRRRQTAPDASGGSKPSDIHGLIRRGLA